MDLCRWPRRDRSGFGLLSKNEKTTLFDWRFTIFVSSRKIFGKSRYF